MDCPELKAAAEDFFQLHFTEVYKLDEFLQLNVTQLTHLLHQDKLTVRAEAQVHVHFLLISQCHFKFNYEAKYIYTHLIIDFNENGGHVAA